MILVIGGAAQGKLAVARRLCEQPSPILLDGETADSADLSADSVEIFTHLHRWVRRRVEAGQPVDDFLPLVRHRQLVVICDEIGCGVIPLAPLEREWREQTGRLCCQLAAEAETVIRVSAGIPLILKGECIWKR